jgi:tetratricopeptide (TPR) repeat protein
MIGMPRSFTRIAVTLAAAVSFTGFVVCSGDLLAQQPKTEKSKQAPDSCIGKTVVTKYGVPVPGVSREPGTDRIFRVYTLQERKGEALRLEYRGESGWIDASEVLLLDNAVDFYNEEIRVNATNVAAYYQRGMLWNNQGESDKAIADFSEVIRPDPKHAAAYGDRGYSWATKKQYDKSIADLTEAVRLDPGYAWAYVNRGYAWSQKNDDEKVIADFNETIRIRPKATWAYVSRGDAWAAKREYDKAIADYTEAIRLNPKYASNYESRGYAWSMKEEDDKAFADYTEAIRLDPRNARAYTSRGHAWSRKHDYDKALADFAEAIRVEPGSPSAYNSRAWIWAACRDKKHRDGKKAVESATQACKLANWKNPDYLETLAAACAETGDFDAAVNWQSKANDLRDDQDELGELRLRRYQEKKPDF